MERFRKDLNSAFLIYLDDIILGSWSEDEHLQDIDMFLKAIARHGMKLRLNKCVFGRSEVKYLGFLLSGAGIRPDPKNIATVTNFQPPKNLTELRSLIGAFSYFRKFIKDFATWIAPLNELSSKEGLIEENWTEEHQIALDTLKLKLTTSPVLASPVFTRPFVIETDASQTAL